MKEFVEKENVIAVVGASANREKWGYRIFRKLKTRFGKVYPVNPGTEHIEGDSCYPDLKSLPEKPDVVVTVVKPEITGKIVEECGSLGIPMIWMQPGSESPEAIELSRKEGIECIHHACFVTDGLGEGF